MKECLESNLNETGIAVAYNKYVLTTTFSGASYEAGFQAGKEAGTQGQAPPVADISIDTILGEIVSNQFLEGKPRRYYPAENVLPINSPNNSLKRPDALSQQPKKVVPPKDNLKPGQSYNNPRQPKYDYNNPQDEPGYKSASFSAGGTFYNNPRDINASSTGGEFYNNPRDDLRCKSASFPTGGAFYNDPRDKQKKYGSNSNNDPRDKQKKYGSNSRKENTTNSLAYKAGVVVGYVDGLAAYIVTQGLLRAGMAEPTDLFVGSEWKAYARGIARESPGIERTAGYCLGFAVRIRREHGVSLNEAEIPHDHISYTAFMKGLERTDEERPLSETPKVR